MTSKGANKKDHSRVDDLSLKKGETLFALIFSVFSLYLLSQITSQTKWFEGVALMQQPRIWPFIALVSMSFFSVLNLWRLMAKQKQYRNMSLFDKSELLYWLRPLEYALYFLAYVFIVPKLGYLMTSIIFSVLLCYRAGYRNKRIYLSALMVAIFTVIIFKSFLQVKIPGGDIYLLMPEQMRNIFIQYF